MPAPAGPARVRPLRRLSAAAALCLAAACGGSSSSSPPPPAVTGVTVGPASVSLGLAQHRQLTAAATRSDGSTSDVTAQAAWSSGAPNLVAVTAGGVVSVGTLGVVGDSATVTASFEGRTGSSLVTLVLRGPIGPGLGNDPLAAQQWHLANTGQKAFADAAGTPGEDLHLAASYAAGFSGLGVKVAVVDTGLEIAHEDLAANVVTGSWNFVTGREDPTSSSTNGDHGTSVAGLVAMVYDNGKGGMGVAPSASLNGYNFLASDQRDAYFQQSLGFSSSNPKSDDVWIFNQSYGTTNTTADGPSPFREQVYSDGTVTLRGGLGAIYVKSAGNGFRSLGTQNCTPTPLTNCCAARLQGTTCQNASMDPANTHPANIVVGALNADGLKASYSSAGSALWVTAPGGEFGLNSLVPGTTGNSGLPPFAYLPAMVTTDQTGCDRGYASSAATTSTFNRGASPNASCNYTNGFNGTSSAAPSTSGAVALLLEANPLLGWRDVKHILAATARLVDPGRGPVVVAGLAHGDYVAELGWTTNGAGYNFHDWYGFGAVDVDQALAMATGGYVNLPAQLVSAWHPSGTVNLPIPDADALGATSTIAVPAPRDMGFIEAVQIQVSAVHPYTGDLGIELTSPFNTRSILLNVNNGFSGADLAGLQLLSNAFYGESPGGNWTLRVVDGAPADTGTLSGWQIRFFGH